MRREACYYLLGSHPRHSSQGNGSGVWYSNLLPHRLTYKDQIRHVTNAGEGHDSRRPRSTTQMFGIPRTPMAFDPQNDQIRQSNPSTEEEHLLRSKTIPQFKRRGTGAPLLGPQK